MGLSWAWPTPGSTATLPVVTTHRALLVFARAPARGRVKTRLAAELGADAALAIYRELGRGVVQRVSAAECDITIAVTPDDATGLVQEWLGHHLRCIPQGSGDLGSRLARAVEETGSAPGTSTVVIGTDCPAVDAALIEAAFRALDASDVVLGPTHDGGYYLVGVRRPEPALFERVPWSTALTLAVTLERALAAGLRVSLLPWHSDIDTAADWRAWQANGGDRGTHPPPGRAS